MINVEYARTIVKHSIPNVAADLIIQLDERIIEAAKKGQSSITAFVPTENVHSNDVHQLVKLIQQHYSKQGFYTRNIIERIDISWIP